MRRTSAPLAVALAALSACSLALAAGCGDDDDTVAQSGTPDAGTDGASGSGFPAEVAAANGTVTIAAQPERIVSLSATATEMLYAIGAGD